MGQLGALLAQVDVGLADGQLFLVGQFGREIGVQVERQVAERTAAQGAAADSAGHVDPAAKLRHPEGQIGVDRAAGDLVGGGRAQGGEPGSQLVEAEIVEVELDLRGLAGQGAAGIGLRSRQVEDEGLIERDFDDAPPALIDSQQHFAPVDLARLEAERAGLSEGDVDARGRLAGADAQAEVGGVDRRIERQGVGGTLHVDAPVEGGLFQLHAGGGEQGVEEFAADLAEFDVCLARAGRARPLRIAGEPADGAFRRVGRDLEAHGPVARQRVVAGGGGGHLDGDGLGRGGGSAFAAEFAVELPAEAVAVVVLGDLAVERKAGPLVDAGVGLADRAVQIEIDGGGFARRQVGNSQAGLFQPTLQAVAVAVGQIQVADLDLADLDRRESVRLVVGFVLGFDDRFGALGQFLPVEVAVGFDLDDDARGGEPQLVDAGGFVAPQQRERRDVDHQFAGLEDRVPAQVTDDGLAQMEPAAQRRGTPLRAQFAVQILVDQRQIDMAQRVRGLGVKHQRERQDDEDQREQREDAGPAAARGAGRGLSPRRRGGGRLGSLGGHATISLSVRIRLGVVSRMVSVRMFFSRRAGGEPGMC
ncbi:MAG: hypothetical protein BWZ08_02620 [candidate division BRC1 bacterium ADurb.BinA292]|nr:MAG: hypothetical protein BWZ08_02620 [candidate division BRC1 bacterium ADurb.BinA292]